VTPGTERKGYENAAEKKLVTHDCKNPFFRYLAEVRTTCREGREQSGKFFLYSSTEDIGHESTSVFIRGPRWRCGTTKTDHVVLSLLKKSTRGTVLVVQLRYRRKCFMEKQFAHPYGAIKLYGN
jgi:hypothetical protein